MIVVDTTVLVYAVGADHPLRVPCRALIEAISTGDAQVSTTPEVIQEFAHVRARRRSRRDAAALARSYTELFAPLVVVDADDLMSGLNLYQRTESLGAFDAVLASAAMRRNASALVSADKGFGTIRGLPYLDPAEPAFAERFARRA